MALLYMPPNSAVGISFIPSYIKIITSKYNMDAPDLSNLDMSIVGSFSSFTRR